MSFLAYVNRVGTASIRKAISLATGDRIPKRHRDGGPPRVQYRIQFLDRSANVIREWSANARDVAGAIELIVGAGWPPRAVTMRVLDACGREVHSATRDDNEK